MPANQQFELLIELMEQPRRIVWGNTSSRIRSSGIRLSKQVSDCGLWLHSHFGVSSQDLLAHREDAVQQMRTLSPLAVNQSRIQLNP